jgi:hypothetical protein
MMLLGLAIAALCGAGVHSASAAIVGTGWYWTQLAALTVVDDTITYGVNVTPHTPAYESLSSHNTTWTRHRASIRCQRTTWPYDTIQQNGAWILSGTIGGPANHSYSGACPAGRAFLDGGAWIDDVW